MAEPVEYSPELNRRRTALQAFLTSLVASAKTSGLYKDGHPMIVQIGERIVNLLQKTLAGEQNITLEVKSKTVLVDETPLPETPEVTFFASSLHTVGVGGVLFTNRLSVTGMLEFFKVLTLKPDEKNTLGDIQKSLQAARIEGMQLVFIQSFVSTGETEQKEEKPGGLTEDQVAAFTRAKTLPDFLTMLLHQNDALRGKEAEAVSTLLERALYREVSLEKLDEGMPWALYDPRIKERFQRFCAAMAYKPKFRGTRPKKGPGPAWSREALASWVAVFDNADLERIHDHRSHDKKDSSAWALEMTHRILDNPASPSHPKYATMSYVRLLRELVQDGRVDILVSEFDRWRAMGANPATAKFFADFRKQVQERVVNQVFAEQFVLHLGSLPFSDASILRQAADFCVFLGDDFVPLLLEELRRLSDKELRSKFCTLLTAVGRSVGIAHLVKALADEDWFLVVNVIGILSEIADLAAAKHVAPVLQHGHAKAREAAMRFLTKFGGADAADGLAGFIAATPHYEETAKAVIALSLLREPGVDRRLLEAYPKTPDYATKVSIVTALGRFPGPEVIRFLKETARRTWYEVFTGLNKELRNAAKHALAQIREEGKA
ncbi:MAG: HEAT repeat domain-containing protein [Elusimicrobia bacterium]|nr:HEAT repeat domain-containing protein [Elusimicrobiota bacterium]